MRRYYCLVMMIVCKSGMVIYAQEWTEQDSIWLQRVLNGTEKIQLNKETQKAIESGTFIHDPTISKQMKVSPQDYPIIESFEGIIKLESHYKHPTELPPAAFRFFVFYPFDSLPDISNATKLSDANMAELKILLEASYKKATVDDPFTLRQGGGSVSFEDILRTIFWPSHRAKMRNAKNANAWKTYNEGE